MERVDESQVPVASIRPVYSPCGPLIGWRGVVWVGEFVVCEGVLRKHLSKASDDAGELCFAVRGAARWWFCAGCCSTIEGHHTPDCDYFQEGDWRDLSQIPGSSWWTGAQGVQTAMARRAED